MHRQPLLEPRDGVDVEVVGRLVEDQQHVVAGLSGRPDLHQRPGERRPAWPRRPTAWRWARRGGHRGRACRGSRPHPSVRPVTSPIVAPASGASWSSTTMRLPRPRRTTPASGSTRPASWRSSVDLPDPLSPTTASRSPDSIVTETSANSGRPGRLAASPDASRRITTPRRGVAPGLVRSHRQARDAGGGQARPLRRARRTPTHRCAIRGRCALAAARRRPAPRCAAVRPRPAV